MATCPLLSAFTQRRSGLLAFGQNSHGSLGSGGLGGG